jgi:formylmethanofuran dehydrogenase subunit C
MTILLRPKNAFKVPIDAECITPDAFATKTMEEIKVLEVWEGNKKRLLDELFEISGDSDKTANEVSIQIVGDLRKVKRIGEGMSSGEITIEGDVGLHLGEKMKGGKITVSGNSDSWLGAMMKGGIITVKGNTGDYVGAAYRGSTKGMRGGTIIIHGNAGNEVGCFMRNGLIKIHGNAGQFVGMHMHDGTIFVQGDSEGRAGASMTGGKIVLSGYTASVLPTFSIDDIKKKVKVDSEEVQGPFYLFTGDNAEKGGGKFYIAQVKNQHLSFYEKYL